MWDVFSVPTEIQIDTSFLNKNIFKFSEQYGWLHHEISNGYEIDNDNSSTFRVSVNNACFNSNSTTTINTIQSVIQTEYTAHFTDWIGSLFSAKKWTQEMK